MAQTATRPTHDHAAPDPLRDAQGGQTRVEQGGEPAPRLPHEHDQSADSQTPTDAEPTEVGKQAHEDVERGLVDTDRGPVMDKLRKKLTP